MAKYITSTVRIYIKHAIRSTKKNQSKKYWDRFCHYVICRIKLQPVSVPVRTFHPKHDGNKRDSKSTHQSGCSCSSASMWNLKSFKFTLETLSIWFHVYKVSIKQILNDISNSKLYDIKELTKILQWKLLFEN